MKDYVAVMLRSKTKSIVTLKIKASSIKEAEQKAELQLPNWKLSIIAKN